MKVSTWPACLLVYTVQLIGGSYCRISSLGGSMKVTRSLSRGLYYRVCLLIGIMACASALANENMGATQQCYLVVRSLPSGTEARVIYNLGDFVTFKTFKPGSLVDAVWSLTEQVKTGNCRTDWARDMDAVRSFGNADTAVSDSGSRNVQHALQLLSLAKANDPVVNSIIAQ